MSARIIDGKKLALEWQAQLAQTIQGHAQKGRSIPGLAVVLVGQNPASQIYVNHKRKACQHIGLRSYAHDLPDDVTEDQLIHLIDTLNQDDAIHGILVQLPLPQHLNSRLILERIAPCKDVDGFHPHNLGALAQNNPGLRPCTPKGVMRLLASTGISLVGLHAVVVGASNIVGKPMALALLNAACTVTICHRDTQHLDQHIKQADILVVAIGHARFVPGHWIKPGAVVVDVGINRQAHGRLWGDIDFDTAKERASWITPVPGGVGPMTVASLLDNTLLAYEAL